MKKLCMFVILATLFLCLTNVLDVRAVTETTQIKVAWLAYTNDWDTEETAIPRTREVLQTSDLKPADWEIIWDVIDLKTASKEDFLAYNLIVVTGHGWYEVTSEDNVKLEFFVRMGGTLWIDNCGGLQLQGFFMPVEFTPDEVGYGGQDVLDPVHPLIDGVYALSVEDVNALGEGYGWSNLLQSYNTEYEGIINEHVSNLMATLSAEYGLGEIVVTAQDILCAIQGYEDPDLKFAYNVMAKAKIRVTIDIKPGSFPNSINPRSKGKIPVAILSTPDFDGPAVVDLASLTFGRSGDEHSLVMVGVEDVNGDGLLDIVAHFDTLRSAFQTGDEVGYLKGLTLYGIPILGTDSVRILDNG